MTIGGALRTKLISTAAVSALIDNRMFHMQAPQAIVSSGQDHITFQIISSTGRPALTGVAKLTTDRIQIDCMSRSGTRALQIRDAVRGAIDGFDGPLSGFVRVVIQREDSGDMPVDITPGTETAWNRTSMDFMVSYNDPAVLLTSTGA